MNYRKLCKHLVVLLRKTRQELEDVNESARRLSAVAYETECRMNRKMKNLRAESEREKEEREYQEWERRKELDKLEEASFRGDTYEEGRIMERLKRI